MSPIVEIVSLRKSFGGTVAVKDLTLSVEEGEILGLIGPNGAGKSTTLKMLATLLRPSAGQAKVGGFCTRQEPERVRRLIGYMPDVCGLYEDMMVHEYLRFFASVYGIRGSAAEQKIDDVLSLTGLSEKAGATCGALSRGMSQRLHLARVLLHDPKLLLLDEPASGLDPRARIEFKELMLTLQKLGKTMIISSHILSELGEMCDAIAIIESSELVYCGPVEDVAREVQAQGHVFRLKARDEPEAGRSFGDLNETVKSRPYVDAVREGDEPGLLLVRFKPEFTDFFALNQELVQRGFKVESWAEEEVRLEDAFLHLTRGIVK